MKLRTLIASLSVFAAFAACAEESLIQNVAVRQLWPWNGKVNIDYYYAGDTATSVTFTATWKGQDTPVDLVGLKDSGAFVVSRGQHRFEWDPAAAGYGDATLYDFKVEVKPGADSRTYLVLDLAKGGYTFLSAVPEGGWTDEYKKTKMVFRRVPAGTYVHGADFDELDAYFGDFGGKTGAGLYTCQAKFLSGTPKRTVTHTSDFYLAIFPMTGRQRAALMGTSSTSMMPIYTFSDGTIFRGAKLADGETDVNWPATGYKVGADSYVDRMRKLSSKTGQDELLIDLPTENQWETAMRMGTDTFFPNGGTTSSSFEEVTTIFHKIAWMKSQEGDGDTWNHDVGLKDPNGWGLYDMYVRNELMLDWANDQGYYRTSTAVKLDGAAGGPDPVGPTSSAKGYRITRGNGQTVTTWSTAELAGELISSRSTTTISSGTYNGCVRFAIHLKPLVDVK